MLKKKKKNEKKTYQKNGTLPSAENGKVFFKIKNVLQKQI